MNRPAYYLILTLNVHCGDIKTNFGLDSVTTSTQKMGLGLGIRHPYIQYAFNLNRALYNSMPTQHLQSEHHRPLAHP